MCCNCGWRFSRPQDLSRHRPYCSEPAQPPPPPPWGPRSQNMAARPRCVCVCARACMRECMGMCVLRRVDSWYMVCVCFVVFVCLLTPAHTGDRIPSSVRLLNVFVTAEQYDLLCQASLGVLGAAACMSRASSSTPSASSRSTCHSGVSTGGGGGESSDVFVSQSSSISSIPLTACE